MKSYLCTVIDSTSSNDNPVKPVQMVVSETSVADFVNSNVDETHYVIIGYVPMFSEK